MPKGLSGGESQRVALGRALSFEPRVLLLDEPLSALDDDTRSDMYALLRSVQKRTEVTVLHVTHNLIETRKLADQVLLLKDGVIQEDAGRRTEEGFIPAGQLSPTTIAALEDTRP